MKWEQIRGSERWRRVAIAATVLVLWAGLWVVPGQAQGNSATDQRSDSMSVYWFGEELDASSPIILFLAEWKAEHGWLPPKLALLFAEYENQAGESREIRQRSKAERLSADKDAANDADPQLHAAVVDVETSTTSVAVTFDEPVAVRLFVSETDGFDTETSDVLVFDEVDFADKHELVVANLEPDTKYFYRLRYRDEAGNVDLSDQEEFTTESE